MAENNRFVSYMYEYRNNERQNNIGYARVETRGDQCKVLLHMTVPSQENVLFKAYMFDQNQSQHHFAYLGNVFIQKSQGELKIKSDRENVMNSGLAIEDLKGILIYSEKKKFYACDWGNQRISNQMIEEIEHYELNRTSEIKKEEKREEKQMIKKQQREEKINKKETPSNESQIQSKENQVKVSVEVQKVIKEENKAEVEAEDEVINTANLGKEKAAEVLSESEVTAAELEKKFIKESQNEETSTQIEENLLHTQELDYMDMECVEPLYGVMPQPMDKAVMQNKDCKKYECHPIAQNIIRRFPRMYPFEDHEITECVRIEPQDIGLLPIDCWVLGNNSFLLHGYYTYRHLLFGKMVTSNGLVYIIGVPGVYHSREEFMAKMFGFEYFKCAKQTEEKEGEFGYFYQIVHIS